MIWLNGIVAILKPDGTPIGTGFVVAAKGYIVTCSHLLGSAAVQQNTVYIRFKATQTKTTAHIEPHWSNPADEEDLTLLFLTDPLPEEVVSLPLISSQATQNHPICSWGYPDTKGIAGWNATGQIKRFTEENNRPRLQFSSKGHYFH
jgi:hypothetical protein